MHVPGFVRRRVLFSATLLGLVAHPAIGADQTLLGKSLVILDPGLPGRQKVTCNAAELMGPNTLVGDPTLGGGVLEVIANGGTATEQRFTLPQGTSSKGKPFWYGAASYGYIYSDVYGQNGPVRTVKLLHRYGTFQLKAKLLGKDGGLTIVPPNPGTDACVALTILGGDRYSMAFGPTSAITNTGTALFKAKTPTVESVCAVVSTTSTTAATTSTTTSTIAGP